MVPDLAAQPQPPAGQIQAGAAQHGGGPAQVADQAALLQATLQLLQQQAQRLTALEHPGEEKKDEPGEKKLGMSKSDVAIMLIMCGLPPSQVEDLPDYLSTLAEQHSTSEGKARVIRALLQDKTSLIYPEAKIPLLPGTVSMIAKKGWSGDSGATSADSATKGLTIFTMGRVSATTIVKAIEFEETLHEATSTTQAEVAKSKKIQPHIPSSYLGLLHVLRTFCNLLNKLFTPTCPLLRELKTLLGYLVDYEEVEQLTFNSATNTVVLWIIFRQTRHFTEGQLTSPNTALPKWLTLLNNISAKLPIHHVGVPPALFPTLPPLPPLPDEKKKRKAEHDLTEPPHKQTPTMQDIIHPKIKTSLTPILTTFPKVTMTHFARCANVTTAQLVNHTNTCLAMALKGKCSYKGCQRDHAKISDSLAEHIINICQPIITNPNSLDTSK